MELLGIEVTGKKSYCFPWNEIQVMPIGDVQLGQTGCRKDKLKEDVAWALKQGNVYFLGMGDYIDLFSPSNRYQWRSGKFYDTAIEAMEDKAHGLITEFLSLVKGSEGHWLGLLEGDHYFAFEDGTTSDTLIAKELKTTFLGSCAFLRLNFKRAGSHGSASCKIWAHHGKGNGLTPHTPLLRLEHMMAYFNADAYLIGHQHKAPAVKVPFMDMTNQAPYNLTAKTRALCGTGGYFEGYHQGSTMAGRPKGSYVECGMMPPVSLGSILLKFYPIHRTHEDEIRIKVEI